MSDLKIYLGVEKVFSFKNCMEATQEPQVHFGNCMKAFASVHVCSLDESK